MLLPRDISNPQHIAALEARYGCVDASACEAALRLLQTANDVVDVFCRYLASHQMSQGRFTVLMILNRDPNRQVMPTELAELCSVTKATMTGLIDGLSRDGLVVRRSAPGDRRATLVGLSKKGRTHLDRMLPAHFKRVAALMEDLGVRDRQALGRLLGKVRGGVLRVATLNERAGCGCRQPSAR